MKKKIKKIVIKVGSSLVANYKTGLPKTNWINSFINDLSFIIDKLQTMNKHTIYNSLDFDKIG